MESALGNSMTCSGIWQLYREWYFQNCPKILKYYEPVLLPNTTCRSYYYLFIIEAEKFSVTHTRPFFLQLKKTQSSTFVTILLRQWKKWLTVFCDTSSNHSRQTTWNSSMTVIYQPRLLRSLHRFLLFYHYCAEIVML